MFLPKGMQHTALVGKTMVRGGRYSAGNRRALNQVKREEGGKDTRDGTPHKITRDLFKSTTKTYGEADRSNGVR